ncbi:MAG: PDZ domain-containing protein, partial [Bacteroidales bacterium]|nr:PDZ domain-containing protein [Bacteroidales bacterium]
TLMMDAIMKSLDPHSRYISAEDLQREMSDIRGNFEGIGATLRSDADTVYVSQTLPGSPARRAGLRTGDRIICVDGEPVSGVKMPIEDVIKRIRGPHGVNVSLGIIHYADSVLEQMVVGRDVIPTNSVSYSGMLKDTIGYVRLTRFSETSYDEVFSAMTHLRGQGMRALILDLRDNGGGLLDAAIRIANEFLSRGDLIVYTQGEHQRRKDVKADGRGRFQDISLTVMLDEFSASASEVVSGAIQDNDRGLIAGRRSFGKGLVQRQFDFSDGSAVWLTVARYYTPSGRCIQRPYDKGTDEYYSEFLQQVLSEASADSTLVNLTDSTRYYTVQGRVVYGGGGIYPDYLLPYHRDSLIAYYNQLVNRRILDRVAFEKVARESQLLIDQYPEEKSFVSRFQVSESMRESVISSGRKAGIEPDSEALAKYGRHIDTLLKAYMAEYLYGFEAFYAVYTTIDVDLQSVLEIVH